MKKLTIIGLSNKVVMDMMPHLLESNVDFIVEDISEKPHIEVEAEPEPPKQIAHVPKRTPEQGSGTLNDLILKWLRHAPDGMLDRDELRDLAESKGYARGSVNAAVSDLRGRGKISTSGPNVSLKERPRPTVKFPYGRPLPEIVLEVLGDREVPRNELVDELARNGIHKPTADTCLNKMMRENKLAYTGMGNNIVRYDPQPEPTPVIGQGEGDGEIPEDQPKLFDLGSEYNGSVQ